MNDNRVPVIKSRGHCPICEQVTDFVSYEEWLRDYFVCSVCGSIPRERALMRVVDQYFPEWRNAVIHESSPNGRGASARFMRESRTYIPSQCFPGTKSGSVVSGMRCEDLEAMSFADATIDLHVTQDVLEHVFDPEAVFREIGRTLRKGGMHIFTVPIVNKFQPTVCRAKKTGGKIDYLFPENYHGNPIGDGRSLVTFDWGFDICDFIFSASGLFTHVIQIDDLSAGIRAEFIDVLVTIKR